MMEVVNISIKKTFRRAEGFLFYQENILVIS